MFGSLHDIHQHILPTEERETELRKAGICLFEIWDWNTVLCSNTCSDSFEICCNLQLLFVWAISHLAANLNYLWHESQFSNLI